MGTQTGGLSATLPEYAVPVEAAQGIDEYVVHFFLIEPFGVAARESFAEVTLQIENFISVTDEFVGFENTFGRDEIIFDLVPRFTGQAGIESIRDTSRTPLADLPQFEKVQPKAIHSFRH